jgi:hypothetical protein
VLTNTTCTAANLPLLSKFSLSVAQELYAEVAEKTSINLPSVMNHKHTEKIAVKVPTRPRRVDIAATRYNTTIAVTGSIDARTIPRNEATRKITESE